MIEGAALGLIALCGFVLCVVVVPASLVRRNSRHGPTGRAHRLASEALRLGWGLVLIAFLLSIALLAVANPLGHQGVP